MSAQPSIRRSHPSRSLSKSAHAPCAGKLSACREGLVSQHNSVLLCACHAALARGTPGHSPLLARGRLRAGVSGPHFASHFLPSDFLFFARLIAATVHQARGAAPVPPALARMLASARARLRLAASFAVQTAVRVTHAGVTRAVCRGQKRCGIIARSTAPVSHELSSFLHARPHNARSHACCPRSFKPIVTVGARHSWTAQAFC